MIRLWAALQSRFIVGEAAGEEGASMVEYAFLIALIAVVVIAGALFLGNELSDKYSEVGDTIEATP
jgi:pilus assembly protein Flp/PilA